METGLYGFISDIITGIIIINIIIIIIIIIITYCWLRWVDCSCYGQSSRMHGLWEDQSDILEVTDSSCRLVWHCIQSYCVWMETGLKSQRQNALCHVSV